MAEDVQHSVRLADRSAPTLESARRDHLDKRLLPAMVGGILLFALDSLEPWFRFHDLVPVRIQLGTVLLQLCLVAITFTRWGTGRKLLIFNVGFLVGLAGFETNVCYTRTFDTLYADGFPTFLAFYCVLIPTTTLQTALVGIAGELVLYLPQVFVTGQVSRLGTGVANDMFAFAFLLYGRYFANKLWEREFLARQQSESFYKHLVQSEKMAALGRLAAGLAHELNNPLAIISSSVVSIERSVARLFAETLPAQLDAVGTALRRSVERLRIGTERMSTVNDLLRQYVSPPLHDMVPSDVNRQLELALSLVESKIGEKTITIHKSNGSNMMLLCDPQTLSHVFVNILDNACDAVAPGGNIWISSEIKEDQVLEIVVRDDGPGLDESLNGRIGEPFVTTKDPGKGLGLGLALCKLIVEKHSGKLEIVNRNPGVEARVTFPASSLCPENSSTVTAPHESTPDAQQLQ